MSNPDVFSLFAAQPMLADTLQGLDAGCARTQLQVDSINIIIDISERSDVRNICRHIYIYAGETLNINQNDILDMFCSSAISRHSIRKSRNLTTSQLFILDVFSPRAVAKCPPASQLVILQLRSITEAVAILKFVYYSFVSLQQGQLEAGPRLKAAAVNPGLQEAPVLKQHGSGTHSGNVPGAIRLHASKQYLLLSKFRRLFGYSMCDTSQRKTALPVSCWFHDTWKATAHTISKEGYVRPHRADDVHFDGDLISPQAPAGSFWQASRYGCDPSPYPRTWERKVTEATRRLLMNPKQQRRYVNWAMYLVSTQRPRDNKPDRALQLHVLFIRHRHPRKQFCDENFLRIDPRTFPPFHYDEIEGCWKMQFHVQNGEVPGRNVKINIVIAGKVRWPRTPVVSGPHDLQKALLEGKNAMRRGCKKGMLTQNFCLCTVGVKIPKAKCRGFHDDRRREWALKDREEAT